MIPGARFRIAFSALLGACLILFQAGCGLRTTGEGTSSCAAGTAQIGVYDTGMKRICGCNESSGAFFTTKTLTCTVKVGTVMYFNYIGITFPHQIFLQSYQSFPVRGSGTTTPDGILLNQTGSYSLTDQYTGLGGTVTITP